MRQALANFDLPILPSIGLLLFLAVFLGVVVWVCRKDTRLLYEKIERFPLED